MWNLPGGRVSELICVLKFDSRGRTVFPVRLRRELGLRAGSQVRVERTDDGLIKLIPVAAPGTSSLSHTQGKDLSDP